jgi:hypothetical protein
MNEDMFVAIAKLGAFNEITNGTTEADELTPEERSYMRGWFSQITDEDGQIEVAIDAVTRNLFRESFDRFRKLTEVAE